MYRIELSPGEETAFRSIEELAVAIRRGVVTSKARIWHNASSKWLPIQFHPHYKAAVAMPLTNADLVVGPPVAPLSSLNIPDPSGQTSRVTPFRPVDPTPQPEPVAQPSRAPARVTPFKPASPYHQPVPQTHEAATAGLPLIEPLGSTSAPQKAPAPLPPLRTEPTRPPLRTEPARPPLRTEPARPEPRRFLPLSRIAPPAEEQPRKKKPPRTRRTSRRALRVAFVGALLLSGAQLLVSAGVGLRPEGLRIHRRLVATSPETTERDTPRTVATVIPGLGNSSLPGAVSKTGRPGAAVPRKPGPTIGTVTTALPSAVPATPPDSASEIQAAPAIEMPAPIPTATDSLTSSVIDSTGKKTLKGILRAVSGAPGSEKKPAKR